MCDNCWQWGGQPAPPCQAPARVQVPVARGPYQPSRPGSSCASRETQHGTTTGASVIRVLAGVPASRITIRPTFSRCRCQSTTFQPTLSRSCWRRTTTRPTFQLPTLTFTLTLPPASDDGVADLIEDGGFQWTKWIFQCRPMYYLPLPAQRLPLPRLFGGNLTRANLESANRNRALLTKLTMK